MAEAHEVPAAGEISQTPATPDGESGNEPGEGFTEDLAPFVDWDEARIDVLCDLDETDGRQAVESAGAKIRTLNKAKPR